MNKFFIIFFLLLGLSGCITTQENGISYKTKTNLNLSQNKIKDDVIEYKFIQWKCYKSSWLNKYKELIYVVGYFPEFQKFDKNNRIGMSFLNNSKSKKLAIYSRQGVQHYWDWGGENFNNYRIIIHPSGNGWLYNFENRKSNEQKSPKQTYDCKSSKTTYIPTNKIKNVINELNDKKISLEKIDESILNKHLYTHFLPDVDLLIRTSGEKRISNFLLWQIAYAELYFTEVLWPDFSKEELYKALINYQNRERRFGKTSEQIT